MNHRAIWLLLFLPILVSMIVGCGGRKGPTPLVTDPDFSINLAMVSPAWPNEDFDWPADALAARLQQEVYSLHGRPDFFRLIWRRDRQLASRQELNLLLIDQKGLDQRLAMSPPEREWIYVGQELIVRFYPTRYEITPLDDATRILTLYGDPHDIKQTTDRFGQETVNYSYFDMGRIFYFKDGRLIKEETQPTIPGWRTRR